MELFSEIYGCYYAVVGRILHAAFENGLTRADISQIVEEFAFAESGLHLMPRLLDGTWAVLREEDGRWHSRMRHAQTGTPLTTLQKAWLKALLPDPRMRLFLSDAEIARQEAWLAEVPPLWQASDFHTFDAALDGDPYTDEGYRRHFALLLAAIREKTVLRARYRKGRDGETRMDFVPTHLQYSAKDDKFRVLGRMLSPEGRASPLLLNVARILALEPAERPAPAWMLTTPASLHKPRADEVLLYIWPERNGLERCMTQFAFYEKETWADKTGSGHYCCIRYPRGEGTELLIRILSFGPVVRVLAPASFVEQVRQRVERQDRLLAGEGSE